MKLPSWCIPAAAEAKQMATGKAFFGAYAAYKILNDFSRARTRFCGFLATTSATLIQAAIRIQPTDHFSAPSRSAALSERTSGPIIILMIRRVLPGIGAKDAHARKMILPAQENDPARRH